MTSHRKPSTQPLLAVAVEVAPDGTVVKKSSSRMP
jgi:hypothetical protein